MKLIVTSTFFIIFLSQCLEKFVVFLIYRELRLRYLLYSGYGYMKCIVITNLLVLVAAIQVYKKATVRPRLASVTIYSSICCVHCSTSFPSLCPCI